VQRRNNTRGRSDKNFNRKLNFVSSGDEIPEAVPENSRSRGDKRKQAPRILEMTLPIMGLGITPSTAGSPTGPKRSRIAVFTDGKNLINDNQTTRARQSSIRKALKATFHNSDEKVHE
jgi:hypothetical protein